MTKTMTVELYQGEDRSFGMKVRDHHDDPVDLTGATGVTVTFPGTTTPVVCDLTDGVTVVAGTLGKLTVEISAANTALMKVGKNQSFTVEYELDGLITARRLVRALTVFEAI